MRCTCFFTPLFAPYRLGFYPPTGTANASYTISLLIQVDYDDDYNDDADECIVNQSNCPEILVVTAKRARCQRFLLFLTLRIRMRLARRARADCYLFNLYCGASSHDLSIFTHGRLHFLVFFFVYSLSRSRNGMVSTTRSEKPKKREEKNTYDRDHTKLWTMIEAPSAFIYLPPPPSSSSFVFFFGAVQKFARLVRFVRSIRRFPRSKLGSARLSSVSCSSAVVPPAHTHFFVFFLLFIVRGSS